MRLSPPGTHFTAESTEAMPIKYLAQGNNILLSGFEPSTSETRNRHSNQTTNMLCVQIKGTKSSLERILCGVPQGSILSPTLIILYLNDICNVSSILEFTLFADDTNIIYRHDSTTSLCNTPNTEL